MGLLSGFNVYGLVPGFESLRGLRLVFVGFVGRRGMSLSINEVFQGSSQVCVGVFQGGIVWGLRPLRI